MQTAKIFIFGGCTGTKWESEGNTKKDQNAFCDSLSYNKNLFTKKRGK